MCVCVCARTRACMRVGQAGGHGSEGAISQSHSLGYQRRTVVGTLESLPQDRDGGVGKSPPFRPPPALQTFHRGGIEGGPPPPVVRCQANATVHPPAGWLRVQRRGAPLQSAQHSLGSCRWTEAASSSPCEPANLLLHRTFVQHNHPTTTHACIPTHAKHTRHRGERAPCVHTHLPAFTRTHT